MFSSLKKNLITLFLVLLTAAFVSGCGGGGGDGSYTGGEILGTGMAGPIQNGVVTAYSDLNHNTVIGTSTLTNPDGSYRIPASNEYLNTNLSPDGIPLFIYIEITGRYYDANDPEKDQTDDTTNAATGTDRTFYIDEATNDPVYIESGNVVLRAATHITYADKERKIAVTPFTDLAVRLAQANGGIDVGTNINDANTTIAKEFQLGELDIIKTLPNAIENSDFHGRHQENAKLYGEALTGLSQLQKDGINDTSFTDMEAVLVYYDNDFQTGNKLLPGNQDAFKAAVTNYNNDKKDDDGDRIKSQAIVDSDFILVVPETKIKLDGLASKDSENELIKDEDGNINGTYFWELNKPEGSTASLTNDNTLTPFFTPDIEGDYVVMLTLTDQYGKPSTDFVTINVSTTIHTIEGIVSMGAPVDDATVTAYSSEDMGTGEQIGSATTDSNGYYQIAVPDKDASATFVYVEVTGGTYTEPATGTTSVSLAANLHAATTLDTANNSKDLQPKISVTPLTELAVRAAQTSVDAASSTETMTDFIDQANSNIGNQFLGVCTYTGKAFNIIRTSPSNVTVTPTLPTPPYFNIYQKFYASDFGQKPYDMEFNPILYNIALDQRLYGMALAGISKLINISGNSSDTFTAFLDNFDNIGNDSLPETSKIEFLTGVSKFYQDDGNNNSTLDDEDGTPQKLHEASTIAHRIGNDGYGINTTFSVDAGSIPYNQWITITIQAIDADGNPLANSAASEVVMSFDQQASLFDYQDLKGSQATFLGYDNGTHRYYAEYTDEGNGIYKIKISSLNHRPADPHPLWGVTGRTGYHYTDITGTIGSAKIGGNTHQVRAVNFYTNYP